MGNVDNGGGYMGNLYLPLNLAVNLNLLSKNKIFKIKRDFKPKPIQIKVDSKSLHRINEGIELVYWLPLNNVPLN